MTDIAATRAEMQRKIRGYQVSQAIAVAARLGIADLLAGGPLDCDALARAAEAHPDALYRLLRFLAGEGVFSEVAPRRFGLTPLADLLRTDLPGSLRSPAMTHGVDWRWRPWGHLLHSVKTGRPAFDHLYGMGLYDYFAQHPDEAAVFNAAMATGAQSAAQAVIEAFDFGGRRTVVDIGGGDGTLLAAILRAYPGLTGILFDGEAAGAEARSRLAAEGVADRCAVVAGDFLTAVPRGGDVYLLKNVIHDWDDDRALTILKNCHAAMRQGGALLLIEMLIPPGDAPFYGKASDLHLLVVLGGRERTEAEYRALLAAAGFDLARVIPTPSELSLIEGIRR